jgi:hypothetical protein
MLGEEETGVSYANALYASLTMLDRFYVDGLRGDGGIITMMVMVDTRLKSLFI